MKPSSAPSDALWRLGLIQTKMVPPRPPRARVGRTTLLTRLEAAADRRLTAVAPAGFGKTTLLGEWFETLRSRGHQVAWLGLDADDDDPQQLGAYVLATLSQGAAGTAFLAADLLREDPLTPIKTLHAVLLNEIATSGRQVYLFLDDLERLTARPSLAVVTRLLRYAPPNPFLGGHFGLALVALAVATIGILATMPLFWTMPTAYLSGPAAAGGIAFINSLGLIGGFVSPFVIGWIKTATGSVNNGLYVMTGLLVIGGIVLLAGIPAKVLHERSED